MFRFRLASVMRIREYKEKTCREELGRSVQDLRKARELEGEMSSDLSRLQKDFTSYQKGPLNIHEISLKRGYIRFKTEELNEQKAVVARKQEELQESRVRLFAAMKDRKVIEKLKDKKHKIYSYEENRREQKILDDLAGHC